MKSRLLGALCAALFSLSVTSAHAVIYSIIDLGTLGGNVSYGWGINDSGQVTGDSVDFYQRDRAFLYDGTTMQDLGALGNYESYGYGINNSGQVTGYSRYSGAGVGAANHAFLYDGTTMQDLGTLGGAQSYGRGINDGGQIVGSSMTSGGQTVAFFYDGNSMLDLCVLAECSSAGWDYLPLCQDSCRVHII